MTDALRRHRRFLMGLFIAAAAFLYLAHIGSYHLIDLDEGRYHRVAMEMVLSGDYITPHFDYMPYFEKPIFQYWITALSMELFGIREFTGRILSALTGLGNVFLAFWLAKTMYNRRTGLLAAVIVATSALQLIVASIGVMDMALTFFIDACLVSFYVFERTENKKYLLVFYAAMGFGMLTKGLIAIVFPFGILFWYALLSKRPRLFLKLFYLPGIILFLVIAVPWYYLVCQKNPDFFYFFFIREHFLRFATKMHERFHPWYYFVPVLIAGLMPWTGFIATFFSKDGIFRKPGSLRHKQDLLLLALWAGLIYVFYSISDSKLPTYILPCWLPLSILLAASIERCRQEGRWLGHSFLINAIICLLFTAAGIAYLMHTEFPDRRRLPDPRRPAHRLALRRHPGNGLGLASQEGLPLGPGYPQRHGLWLRPRRPSGPGPDSRPSDGLYSQPGHPVPERPGQHADHHVWLVHARPGLLPGSSHRCR